MEILAIYFFEVLIKEWREVKKVALIEWSSSEKELINNPVKNSQFFTPSWLCSYYELLQRYVVVVIFFLFHIVLTDAFLEIAISSF